MSQLRVHARDGDVRVSVKVKPRASRSAVLEVREGALVVAVAAPPVDGAANAELERTVARWIEVAPSAVRVVTGATGRTKVLAIAGVTPEAVLARVAR